MVCCDDQSRIGMLQDILEGDGHGLVRALDFLDNAVCVVGTVKRSVSMPEVVGIGILDHHDETLIGCIVCIQP